MNTIVTVLLFTFIPVLSIMHKRVNTFNPSDFPLLRAQNTGYKITLKLYEFIISALMHTYAQIHEYKGLLK